MTAFSPCTPQNTKLLAQSFFFNHQSNVIFTKVKNIKSMAISAITSLVSLDIKKAIMLCFDNIIALKNLSFCNARDMSRRECRCERDRLD